MNALVRLSHLIPHGDIVDFHECCTDYQWFYANGWIDLHTAVDNLQQLAWQWELISEFGQDFIQQLIAYEHTVGPPDLTPYQADYVRRVIETWEAADATRPRPSSRPVSVRYQPAASTVDAFFYVARAQSAEYLARWLAEHPLDAPHLRQIWIKKNAHQ